MRDMIAECKNFAAIAMNPDVMPVSHAWPAKFLAFAAHLAPA